MSILQPLLQESRWITNYTLLKDLPIFLTLNLSNLNLFSLIGQLYSKSQDLSKMMMMLMPSKKSPILGVSC